MRPHEAPEALTGFVARVVPYMHGDEKNLIAAATVVAIETDKPRPKNDNEAITLLWELVRFLLFQGFKLEAAKLLWDPAVFDYRPECVTRIWGGLEGYALLGLQGASSMGKSYTPCVWLMLDWLMDPQWTSIICLAPNEDHLRANVFSTLSRLHQGASLPMPGESGDLFIGKSRKDKFGGFKGKAITRGQTGIAIQGLTKTAPRIGKPHPVFGARGRVRVFIDELEDCPPLIFQDLSNAVSSVSKSDPDRSKIIGAYNPKHPNGRTAELAEPPDGWAAFDLDRDHEWDSKKGWHIIRLDAHRSENVLQGVEIYAGIQSKDALDALRAQAGSEDAAHYLTYGRGAFPRTLSSVAAVPQKWLDDSVGEVVWAVNPTRYAGIDLSNGGDAIVSANLLVGYALLRRWPGWQSDPARTFTFNRPRPVIFVESLDYIPGENTPEIAKNIKAYCEIINVAPRCVNVDPGGPGSGVTDMIREYWDPDIKDTLGGSGVTDNLIFEEDRMSPADTPNLRYSVDEQWLAVRRYFEHGFIVVSPKIDSTRRSRLFDELSKRLWKDQSMTKLEVKNEFKKRNQGRSCDMADALALGVHGARIGDFGFRPSVLDGCRSVTFAEAKDAPALAIPSAAVLHFGPGKTGQELLEDLLAGPESGSRDLRDGCDPTNRMEWL